ncbi:putative transcriptional regulator tpeD [Wolffia australiana]
MDAWTSRNNLAFLGVTAHWIYVDWKRCELLLAIWRIKGSDCDTNLARIIVEVAYEYGIESKLCSITMDNASNNITMLASIVDQLKTIIRNPDAPESSMLRGRDFQTYAALAMDEPTDSQVDEYSTTTSAPLGIALSSVRAIVNAIQGSTQHMEKYVDMCKMFELLNSIKIKGDCPMRWNSTFMMLECALAKREVLDHMAVRFLSTLTKDYALCQEDWELIDEYLCILGPLRQGSDYLCSTKILPITEVVDLGPEVST